MPVNPVLFIVGPTASGKTGLSLKLAETLNAEIVSCDSMQVYRGMNIGTDKVSPAGQKKIRHHLVDVVDSSELYSAYDYRNDALECLSEITKRGHLPIVAGGSGLYYKSLVDGIAPSVGSSDELRKQLEDEVATKGSAKLHVRLQSIDPVSAEKIHPNDAKRIVRALEIHAVSGRKPSEIRQELTGLSDLGYKYKVIALKRDRQSLYRDAELRVDKMLELGLVDEVRSLQGRLSLTTRQAVGYKEILSYLNKEISLDEAVVEIKKNTRHLVKKQFTWFLRDERIEWYDKDEFNSDEALFEKVLSDVKGWL